MHLATLLGLYHATVAPVRYAQHVVHTEPRNSAAKLPFADGRDRTCADDDVLLILFAMLPILPPGIHRLYMVPLGMDTFPVVAMYATLDAMAIAIIAHEWRQSGTINKCTYIGAGWLVLQQILHAALIKTAFFGSVVLWLGGLVYYR